MTRKEALENLLARVEAGEHWRYSEFDPTGLLPEIWLDAYHGSLDAAKELHEAVLPGWTVRLCAFTPHGNSAPYAHVFRMRQTEADPAIGANSTGYTGNSPARAWLIAILKALTHTEASREIGND